MTVRHRMRSVIQGTDLAWGARQGIFLAGLALIPAAIVAATRPLGEIVRLLPIGGAYLLFGAFAGLIVGTVRYRLRRLSIAVSIGSIVGALGFSLLMSMADRRGVSRLQLIFAGALLGVAAGAFLGWWAWRRSSAQQAD